MSRVLIIAFLLGAALAARAQVEAIDYDTLLRNLQEQRQELALPLYLDGHELGALGVVLRGDRLESFSLEALEQLLPVDDSTAGRLRQIAEEHAAKRRFDPAVLAPLDIALSYDPVALRIVATVLTSRLRAQLITSSPLRGSPAAAVDTRASSVFINARYGYQDSRSETSADTNIRREHNLDLETGLGLGQWLFESSGLWRSQPRSGAAWRRNYTRLVRDNVHHGSRLTIGDLSYRVEGFQHFNALAGIGFSSNRQLTGNRVGRSTSSESFLLESNSRVAVYVNNRLVRSLYLPRGNYQIRDLPGVSGVNDVRLVIDNAMGEQTEIDYSFVFSQDFLAGGEHDYSYNLGVSRQASSAGNTYGNAPLLSVFHRYGVHNGLTLGANMQAAKHHYMPGLQLQWAGRLGALSSQVAYSFFRGQTPSGATQLHYRYEKPEMGLVDLSWRFFEPAFVAPGTPVSPGANTRKSQSLVSFSKVLGRHFVARGSYGYFTDRSALSRSRLWEVGVAGRFFQRLSISAALSRGNQAGRWEDTEFRLDLNWHLLQSDQSFHGGYESASERYQSNYRGRYASGQHQLDAQFAHEQIYQRGSKRSSALVYYQNHRLDASTSYEHLAAEGGNRQAMSRFGVGGALVMANKHFAFSRPIAGSFAVVTTDAELGDAYVGVNPHRYGGFQSTISRWSPAVISGLAPYYSQNVAVDASGTELHYETNLQNLSVVSRYKSGSALFLPTSNNKNVRGRLIGAGGRALSYTAGEALVQAGGAGVLFFTDEEGKFELTGIKPGEYQLKLYGELGVARVVIADRGGKNIDLGTLQVESGSKPRPVTGDQ